MTARGSPEWARAAADRAEQTARRATSKNQERKDSSSSTASGEGASLDGMAEMSAENFQRTLAEGGEGGMNALVGKAKKAPGSVFEAETLSALTQLAKANFPAWVNLRARLKTEARGVLF